MAAARRAARRAAAPRRRAQGRVRGAPRTSTSSSSASAAQRALGHVDAPSELLLALDRRIQHLLVDEFQDTSQSQRRLLELLDGRLGAGRRPHAVPRRRSDAVDLSLSRRRHVAIPRREAARHRRRAARSLHARGATSAPRRPSCAGSTPRSRTCSRASRRARNRRAPRFATSVATRARRRRAVRRARIPCHGDPGGEASSVVEILAAERRA